MLGISSFCSFKLDPTLGHADDLLYRALDDFFHSLRLASHISGIHVVHCAVQSPSATETGSEPKSRDRGLSILNHLRASLEELQRPRARASTRKFSDLRLARRALGPSYLPDPADHIELRKLVLVFLFQVRRCEQVQYSEGIPNLHPRILEELRGCAVRDLHDLLWVDTPH